MSLFEFNSQVPSVGKKSYIFDSADVIGNVTIGECCFIGPGARIRGDYGKIVIGDKTSIEDNCVIHARPNEECWIGKYVTVGHGSVIHNATIKDWAVIGMNAVVSDYSEIGEWSVVAEGCVVKNNQKIPSEKIAVGIPAKIVADTTKDYKKQWTHFKEIYATLAEKTYREQLKKIDIQ